MHCCSECFSSSYLKDIINSNVTIGDCDFCGTTNISIYDPKELALFFQNIFDLYKVDSKIGASIEIQTELDFQGKIIKNLIIKDGQINFENLSSGVYYLICKSAINYKTIQVVKI